VAGVAIGFCDEARFAELLRNSLDAGYRRVKCKIEPGRDRAVLHAARDTVGDGFPLAADANGSYTLADATTLATLDPFDLQCLEQPLAPDALADHASLAARIRAPLCLDESVTSATVARDAIACGAGLGGLESHPGRGWRARDVRPTHFESGQRQALG